MASWPDFITVRKKKFSLWGFPGGPVVKNCLAMQGTQVQSLVWEDHTWDSWARVPQLLSLRCLRACKPQVLSPCTTTREQTLLEKTWTQQWRPSAAKNRFLKIICKNVDINLPIRKIRMHWIYLLHKWFLQPQELQLVLCLPGTSAHPCTCLIPVPVLVQLCNFPRPSSTSSLERIYVLSEQKEWKSFTYKTCE